MEEVGFFILVKAYFIRTFPPYLVYLFGTPLRSLTSIHSEADHMVIRGA